MVMFLGTVALEKNRWAPGRIPTVLVSDYLRCMEQDGFDGIELWANHYLMADRQEQRRIADSGMTAVFNSYVTFADGVTEDLRYHAEAISTLRPQAVKFNLGPKMSMDTQLETLRRFADMLHPQVRLLCECHANTLMEDPELAAEVFCDLDERFGAIVHLSAEPAYLQRCLDHYGSRICHIHAQYSENGAFAPMERGKSRLLPNFQSMTRRGFQGTLTVEFSEGQEPEEMYANAVSDLHWLKANLK